MKCFTCAKTVERSDLWYRCDCGDARHVDEVVRILSELGGVGYEGPLPPPRTRVWCTFSSEGSTEYVGDVNRTGGPLDWKEVKRHTDYTKVLAALRTAVARSA